MNDKKYIVVLERPEYKDKCIILEYGNKPSDCKFDTRDFNRVYEFIRNEPYSKAIKKRAPSWLFTLEEAKEVIKYFKVKRKKEIAEYYKKLQSYRKGERRYEPYYPHHLGKAIYLMRYDRVIDNFRKTR
jgi:hypothetical protein